MSKEHPVVVVTGSSGAGTTSVRIAFQHIFRRLGVKPFYVEGDSFHKYDRNEMRRRVEEALEKGEKFGHFSLEANLLEKLQELFESYGRTGHGQQRFYIHTVEEAQQWGREPGTFTPWQDAGEGTDLLFYEGLHGAVVADGINIVEHADLLIGVVPIVAGRILIDGRDVTRQAPEQRRIGIVYQDHALFPHLTVEENIVYGQRYCNASLPSVTPLVERLGLTRLMARRIRCW